MMLDSDSLPDALIDAYADTIIEIHWAGTLWRIRQVAHGAAGPLVWPTDVALPVHVITACNPGSVKLGDAENRRRQERLEGQLRTLDSPVRPAVGRSADGSWVEPSFAVAGLDRLVACELGRSARQLAIYELADDVLTVRCDDGQAVIRRSGLLEWP